MKLKRSLSCIFLCAVMIFSVTACNVEEDVFWHKGNRAENRKFKEITEELFQKSYENDMLDLHFTVKNPQNYGIKRPKMNLFSTSSLDYEDVLDDLKRINYDGLSRENQITYDIIQEDLTDSLNDNTPNLKSYFDYSSGIQTNLVTLATEYEFFIEQDIIDYLDMIEQMPDYFDYLYAWEQKRVEDGYGLSDAVLAEVKAQFANVYGEGEESCFITSFNEKIDSFKGLTAAKKAKYKEENRNLVLNGLFPAYQEIEAGLCEFEGRGVNDGGLCGFENGKTYYENLAKSKSGYGGTVEELYNELLNFINLQMLRVFVLAQFNGAEYERWLNGEAKPMTDAVQILDYFSQNLTEEFPAIKNTTYTIKYLSESIAQTMPNTLAYYLIPQIDNYKNGAITVNGFSTDDAQMMNTLAHEGYPGHLYQNVYFMSKNPDPVRSLFSFSGYTEGWAVYAANRAEYLYEYPENDTVYSQLNDANVSFSYAVSAMVDIAVNYYGMSAKELQTITRYWEPDEEAATQIRNSVIKMPGAYLSYGVGNMMMFNLRSYAETREGEAFDAVDFHRLILDVGPCNFDLLYGLTEEYYDVKIGTTFSPNGSENNGDDVWTTNFFPLNL